MFWGRPPLLIVAARERIISEWREGREEEGGGIGCIEIIRRKDTIVLALGTCFVRSKRIQKTEHYGYCSISCYRG